MECFVNLDFGGHEELFFSQQQTVEIHAKVIFEESFPFKELEELVTIIDKADPLTRLHILPKALKVANRMKIKFSNSLSEEYNTWLVKVEGAISKFNVLEKK
jgi:hypothetical protein